MVDVWKKALENMHCAITAHQVHCIEGTAVAPWDGGGMIEDCLGALCTHRTHTHMYTHTHVTYTHMHTWYHARTSFSYVSAHMSDGVLAPLLVVFDDGEVWDNVVCTVEA